MEPGYREHVICIGQNLRINGGANHLPLNLQSQLKEMHDMVVHASRCELDLECKYPKCLGGKVLWHHIFMCPANNCLLCNSMRHIVLFHARQCSDSNCLIPRCRDFKDKIRLKEKIGAEHNALKPLKGLLKKKRAMPLSTESQLVDATAALQLSSKEEDEGDQSPPRMSDYEIQSFFIQPCGPR